MNESIKARAFGPIRDLSITFKKTTLLIGDQGTGKSCVAKLFSTFKWLEKALVQRRYKTDYYEKYNRCRKLFEYHQIDHFLNDDTYIEYRGEVYSFSYKSGIFKIKERKPNSSAVCKVMYVPAERSIVSIAENKNSLLKQLPSSSETFNDRVTEAKKFFKDGYTLPFGGLNYKYDQLNNISKIIGQDHEVFLREASSGVQSSLPLCIVSNYLAKVVQRADTEIKLSDSMQRWIDDQVAEILSNDAYSDPVKRSTLKRLSQYSFYNSFINIVEEPELNLFPSSQLEVLKALTADNASTPANMLLITTHSPYTLAIFNLFIMAYLSQDEEKLPKEYHINPTEIAAYRLSNNPEEEYCKSIINDKARMIFKNDLDAVSEQIMVDYNSMLRKYAQILRPQQDGK